MVDQPAFGRYRAQTQVQYDAVVVELGEHVPTEKLEAILNDSVDALALLLTGASEGSLPSGPAGGVLHEWILREVDAKRRLLEMHRPVAGRCMICAFTDAHGHGFAAPAAWPCPTVAEVIGPLREVFGS